MNIEKIIQLKPHEEILQVVRGSFVPRSGKFFLLGLWFLIPFFFLFPLFRLGTWGIIGFFILVLSGIFLFWRAYRTWSQTVFVITDLRIIDIDQHGFFDQTVTEVSYPKIEEVTYRIKGLLATLFRYGTLRLRVTGDAADIEFARAKFPAGIQELINDLRSSHG